MYKTGHSLIKAQMKAIEAAGGQVPLGGEMSGHIFFKERWYGFDDGTYDCTRSTPMRRWALLRTD
jgi:phosphomannomutase